VRSGVDVGPDGVRWPVVDGISWRRTGREELRARVVALLDDGEVDAARTALLADNDDWWTADPPPPEQLARVASATTLREALDLLGAGRVGDYFLHRWSDPTYLAALALVQAHGPGDRPVVEVACGVGHLLRELAQRGARDLVGVDVVFAKTWLAQRFVCPSATYVCADATDLPLDLLPRNAYVLCVDALYFVRDKPGAVRQLRALGETLVVGHVHTPAEEVGAGLPLPVSAWRDLLGAHSAYDDAELTAAFLERRPPKALEDGEPPAVALVAGPTQPGPDLARPVGDLRANPLYVDGVLTPPNDRWAQEYAAARDYLPERLPDPLPDDAAHRRLLLDLPAAW
jgi:SAM-dependent methyltransferase